MNVAAVQFKPHRGDKPEALRQLVTLARAAAAGSDLIVLPEMAATGYLFADPAAVRPVAETPAGETFQALSPVAREAGAWLVCGFVEDAGDRLYNAALVIDRAGKLAFTYRKTLLFEADTAWATPGDSGYRTFDTGRGTFGVGICMDLNDDRFTAWCATSGARAIAFPTNCLDQGDDVWPYWAWRLREVPAALVAANTYGPEGEIAFRGTSCILDGRVVRDAAPRSGDAIVRATLPAAR
jgi:N-carbamoylputrescine amidase